MSLEVAILDVPSPIDLRDPRDAREWADAAESRTWRPVVRAAIARLVPSGRVLELGPGPGLLAAELLANAAITSYTLFDFSPPFLDMCRARFGGDRRVHFVLGDFAGPFPAFADAPFDAVIAMQAVHEVRHKRHVPALYRRACDVLRPSGLLAICDHVPRDESPLHSTLAEQHAAMSLAGFASVTTHIDDPLMYLVSARRSA